MLPFCCYKHVAVAVIVERDSISNVQQSAVNRVEIGGTSEALLIGLVFFGG